LFPATIELSVSAMLFRGRPGACRRGILAATRRGKFLDHSVMGVSLVDTPWPIFWWGLLLILVFLGRSRMTPVSGRIDIAYDFDSVTGLSDFESLLSGQDGGLHLGDDHLSCDDRAGHDSSSVIATHTRSLMLEVLKRGTTSARPKQGPVAARVVWITPCAIALDPGDHRHRASGRKPYGGGQS